MKINKAQTRSAGAAVGVEEAVASKFMSGELTRLLRVRSSGREFAHWVPDSGVKHERRDRDDGHSIGVNVAGGRLDFLRFSTS